MSAATGLRHWKETAGQTVEKSSPYVKRGSKWFIVHILTPLLFYLKEVAIATAASVLAGCQTLWSTALEPFLSWIVDAVIRLIQWIAEEVVAAVHWGWDRLTPWESA